jgi:structural maintenance of chromosome 2
MYETKKENALKTLDKKQTKVDEINKVRACAEAALLLPCTLSCHGAHALSIAFFRPSCSQLLEEDILPALEKLRKERGDYMRWTSANDKLERLRRFCVAYEFVRACAAKESSTGGTEDLKTQMRALAAEAKAIEADIAQHAANTKRLCAEKDGQMNGEVKRLSEEVDAVSKHLVQETAAWTNKKDVLSAERDAERGLRTAAAELEATIAEHDSRAKQLDAEFVAARSALDALVSAADEAERTLTGVQSGKGTGDNKSLAEKLADAKTRASAAEAEVKSAEMRSAHLTKELAVARKALLAKQKDGSAAEAELVSQQAAADACRQAMKALCFEPASLAHAEKAVSSATVAVATAQEKVDVLSSQLASLDFQFRDPERGFDRSRVKGKVAKLLRVKDAAVTTALEVLAGGKLFQLVVDTDSTGKALLAHGQLKQRVTIIPLNRVQSRTASVGQQAAAASVSGGAAKLALSLVGYDDEVQAAMQYVFGAGFVCKVRPRLR